MADENSEEVRLGKLMQGVDPDLRLILDSLFGVDVPGDEDLIRAFLSLTERLNRLEFES